MRRIPAVRRALALESARTLSPTVRELVLRTDDGAPIDFLAGQWIKLYLPGGVDRDYSIASRPDPARPDRIVLAVTLVEGGPGSTFLHAMQPGDRVDSLGPSGFFVREDHERAAPALYVGTGTGLAPLRAMLQDEVQVADGPPQILLFGCRSEDEVLWGDEIAGWAERCPRFSFLPTLSRANERWSGRRGYVQTHLHDLVRAHPGAHLYVCGLSRMVGDVRRILKEELRVDRRQVHSERYD